MSDDGQISLETFRKLAEDTYGAERFAGPEAIERAIDAARDKAPTDKSFQEDAIRDYLGEATLMLGEGCVCDADLMGLLGTFTWGIQHGFGKCSRCGAGYRLYHYVGEKPQTFFQALELVSIPKERIEAPA